MYRSSTVILIAAMDRHRVIGRDGDMPWHLPEDLRHFKRTTLGHPVIMGRLTWESIGRPLPGRRNVVVTRDSTHVAEGCEVVTSMEAALERAAAGDGGERLMVIGGGEIYRLALPWADELVLTHVDVAVDGGDTWFPDIDEAAWEEIDRRDLPADEETPALRFLTLRRRGPS